MPAAKTLINDAITMPAKEKVFVLRYLFPLIIGVLFGSIALLKINNVFGFYLLKALQLILFYALGNLYISAKQNRTKPHLVEEHGNHILPITFSLCVLLIALYIFFKKDVWLMALSSSAAFLLPYILKLCWQLFTAVRSREFNTWFPDILIAEKAPVTLDSLVIRLKITQHVSDVDEKIYTVFIPHYMSLGDFFSHFLAGHKTHIASLIEDVDGSGNKYAWVFFETGFFGLRLRRLNPHATMMENKIKKDAVIYIKRLKQLNTSAFQNKNLLNGAIK